MDTSQTKIEKLFFLLLIINPFFDLIGALFVYINYDSIINGFMPLISPSLYIRMGILLLFFIYIIFTKDKQSFFVLIPIGIAWAFTIAGELIFAIDFDLLTEVKYMAKFIFNICVILVYWRVFQNISLSKDELFAKINRIIAFTALLLTTSIIICSIANIGFLTREYLIAFKLIGSRGIFYAGNDITAILMLLFPLSIAFYLKMKDGLSKAKRLFWLITPAMVLSGLLQIGIKTALIAVICTIIGMFIYVIIHRIKQKHSIMLKRMGMIIVAAVIINISIIGIDMLTPVQSSTLLSIKPIAQASEQSPTQTIVQATTLGSDQSTTEEIYESKKRAILIQEVSENKDLGLGYVLFGGRLDRLEPVIQQFKDGGLYAYLFGIGRGSQDRTIEMDLFECLIYYGIIGAIAMLWLYVKLSFSFIRNFFKKIDVTGVALLLSLGLTTGYLIIAGHVLFSVSSGFYYAFVILYSTLYYANDIKKTNIIKT